MSVLENNGKQCAMDSEVTVFDCDMNRKLCISSVMKYMENVAEQHLSYYKMSYSEMAAEDTVFLLTCVNLRFHRVPEMREKFRYVTWQRKSIGVQFLRDTEFYDLSGNSLIECTANWILADPVQHRIKRPREYPKYATLPQYDEHPLFGNGHAKIEIPDSIEPVGVKRVMYSDVDYNHHLNNTKYADIVCDYIPGLGKELEIYEIKLCFNGEAYQDDEISISRAVTDENHYVIIGTHSRGKCFEAEIFCRKKA